MALTYPLSRRYKENIDAWVETLPLSDLFNGVQQSCASCAILHEPSIHPRFDAPEDAITVLLPCGCPYHRTCLRELFDPTEDDDDYCLHCHCEIFVEQSIDEFFSKLTRVALDTIRNGQVDNECTICRTEYIPNERHDPEVNVEQPMMLSCGHVFGERCLRSWLSPTEGMGNTCPICRERLFTSHHSVDLPTTNDLGDFQHAHQTGQRQVLNTGHLQFEETVRLSPEQQRVHDLHVAVQRLREEMRNLNRERNVIGTRINEHYIEEHFFWHRYLDVHDRVHELNFEDSMADFIFIYERLIERGRNARALPGVTAAYFTQWRIPDMRLLADRVMQRQQALTRRLVENMNNMIRLEVEEQMAAMGRPNPFA